MYDEDLVDVFRKCLGNSFAQSWHHFYQVYTGGRHGEGTATGTDYVFGGGASCATICHT